MARVAVIGHLCVDLRPRLLHAPTLEPGTLRQVGPITVALGGAVANTGRVLAVLGTPVLAWAAVGDDDLGAIIRGHLGRIEGLEFRPQAVDATTSYTIVIEPPGTDRTFWNHPGSNALLDLDAIAPDGVELVHFGYPSLMPGVCADGGAALTRLFGRAREQGIATSLDLAWVDPESSAAGVDWPELIRALLPLTDVVSPSYDDLACIFDVPSEFDPVVAGELVERLLGWGAGIVMLTAGDEGLVLGAADSARLQSLRGCGVRAQDWADGRLSLPASPVTRVSTTTGAGDAATAGLLHGLCGGLGPVAAGRLAADVASAVIEQGGTEAFTGIR